MPNRVGSRRELFAAMGGAALALPFLRLTEGKARAQLSGKHAKNLIVFYTPNGVYHQAFWPLGGERDFKLNEATAPVEKYRDKLIMVGPQFESATSAKPKGGTGLRHMVRPPQHQAQVVLTGDPVGAPYRNQTGDGLTAKTSHPSLDQLVANKVGANTRFRSLEFGLRPVGGNTPSSLNFAMDGSPLPRMTDASLAWKRIFEGVMGTAGMPAPALPAEGRARQVAVTNFLSRRFASLGKRLGQEDRHILENHMESIREVEARAAAKPMPSASCSPGNVMLSPEDDVPATARNFQDMIALSFACDLTRVASVTFGYPGGGGSGGLRGSWLGFNDAHHSLSHHGNNGGKLDKLKKLMRWFAEQVTYTLDQLARYPHPDGGGSLLDHSIVYWCSRHGEGNGHTNEHLPNVIAGGAGGFFGDASLGKGTGRFLQVPATNNCSLLLTLAWALGVEAKTFGVGKMMTSEPIAALV